MSSKIALACLGGLGVLYYAIYNPDYWVRDNHEPLEVYRLVEGEYVRQPGEPVWMPEIELGIGRGQGSYGGWQREWLYWCDRSGNRYSTPDERAQRAEQRAEEERQRLVEVEQQLEQERRLREELIARLLERGIDPDALEIRQRHAFLQLPLEERRLLLAEQAEAMAEHYQQDSDWREFQVGDLIEY